MGQNASCGTGLRFHGPREDMVCSRVVIKTLMSTKKHKGCSFTQHGSFGGPMKTCWPGTRRKRDAWAKYDAGARERNVDGIARGRV